MVGLGAGMMTALQYQAQGNVQWLLVCVVVNLRIFITRRMNSRMTISFRKRTAAAAPPPLRSTIKVYGLQDVEHLRRTVQQALAFVSDAMRYL